MSPARRSFALRSFAPRWFALALVLAAGCGAAPDNNGDADGGTPGDDGAASSADLAQNSFATPYFPLQSGLQWVYKQTQSNQMAGTACYNDGSSLTLTMGEIGANGYPVQYQPACFYSEVDYQISGNQVLQTALGGTYVAFDFPPMQGKTWAAGGASGVSYVWDMHFDSYTVAAGTFSDCWRASYGGGANFDILCSGVGAVLYQGTEFQDYRWELQSKNF